MVHTDWDIPLRQQNEQQFCVLPSLSDNSETACFGEIYHS